MKTRAVYFIVGLLFASLISESLSICDDSVEVLADVCSRLNHQIESALLEDAGNAYRLRKAFFYAPNARPVLIKVVYNVTLIFARNVTKDTQLQQNYCIDNADSDNTITAVNSTTIVLGWTSSGVFIVFHPLTINFMLIQLPFVLKKVMFGIFRIIDPLESGPEAETLLWDGSYELQNYTSISTSPI